MRNIFRYKFEIFLKKRFSLLALNKRISSSRFFLLNKNVTQKRSILFKMNNEVPNRIVGYYVL